MPRRAQDEPENPPLAKVLANPWKARILRELTLRPLSMRGFAEEVGGTPTTIRRHFLQLEGWGFIEVVETRSGGPRYGGVERLYRALHRDELDAADWAALSQEEREAKSSNMIASYWQRVIDAVEAGTFDADLPRHWTWEALELDETAFRELGQVLEAVQARARELAEETRGRLGDSGGETIWTTLGLGAFRSPREEERHGPPPTPEGDDPLPPPP